MAEKNRIFINYQFLDSSFEDIAPIHYHAVEEVLKHRYNLIVFHEDRLIGYMFNEIFERKDFPKIFPYGFCHENPKLELLPDYAKKVKNGPFSTHASNQMWAILDECFTRTGPFLPPDVKKFANMLAAGCHQDYQNSGIANFYGVLNDKLFKIVGCDAVTGTCVVGASFYLCTKHVNLF